MHPPAALSQRLGSERLRAIHSGHRSALCHRPAEAVEFVPEANTSTINRDRTAANCIASDEHQFERGDRWLIAVEDVARMYQEPGLAWLERQAEVAEELVAQRNRTAEHCPGS